MTVSKSTADELKKIGIHKIEIIENGIECMSVKSAKKEVYPTFIFVSRVVKMKGIEDVIEAFEKMLDKLKNAELWIVGDGDEKYKNDLEDKIKRNKLGKKIKFYGKVSENKKFELMKKSHLLLHASVKEGWGLVVLEAASQGTPAVVYNVPGLRDSVINEQTGIVLKNNTPFEMAAEAISLINDKTKYLKFQKNSIEWARSLTWEKSTGKSLKLIENLSK